MRSATTFLILAAGITLAITGPGIAEQLNQPQPVVTGTQAKQVTSTDYRRFVMPSDDQLRQQLTPLQYKVTQKEGTERPFKNEYWNNKQEGIYVDIVSGEPLFSSKDKYKSGTGWPSFVRPIAPGVLTEHEDKKLWMTRVELRSKVADSHLGHVFTDGPKPTGLRYCINSASLRFIPVQDLEKEGYGEYLAQFEADNKVAEKK